MAKITCICGEEFNLQESYAEHLKTCTGPEQKVITFDLATWNRFLSGLGACLIRQMGDKRTCPKCKHEFVPHDATQEEAANAFASIFPDEAQKIAGTDD